MVKAGIQSLDGMSVEELRSTFASFEKVQHGLMYGADKVRGAPEERDVLIRLIKGLAIDLHESETPVPVQTAVEKRIPNPAPSIPHTLEQIDAAIMRAQEELKAKFNHLKGIARIKMQRVLYHRYLSDPSGT